MAAAAEATTTTVTMTTGTFTATDLANEEQERNPERITPPPSEGWGEGDEGGVSALEAEEEYRDRRGAEREEPRGEGEDSRELGSVFSDRSGNDFGGERGGLGGGREEVGEV